MFNDAAAALHRTGAMQPRVPQPSRALLAAQKDVTQLVLKWDDALATRIAADNLFLDETLARRAARIRELQQKRVAHPLLTTPKSVAGRWRMKFSDGMA